MIKSSSNEEIYIYPEISLTENCSAETRRNRWRSYFRRIAQNVASNSPCMRRKIGCVLVRDNVIIASGYNGPPRGVPHCSTRHFTDVDLMSRLKLSDTPCYQRLEKCPRTILSYSRGTGFDICPVIHAESNCLLAAARVGVSTKDATLYTSWILPCKKCIGELINAGISEIICVQGEEYDNLSHWLVTNSTLKVSFYEDEKEISK